MALDYDTDGTGLFFHVGQVVRNSNLLADDADAMDDDLESLLANFEAGDQQDKIESAIDSYGGVKSSLISQRSTLADFASQRLQDRDTIINELNIATDSIGDVLAALIIRMNTDSETVVKCTAAAGAVTAGASNIGNGTVLADLSLDGVTAPTANALPQLAYNALTSQFPVNETVTLICTADSYTDGLTSGEEQFAVSGEIRNADRWALEVEGSGQGPSLTTLNAGSIILNKDFEDFATANTPDSWTLTGTAGTHIFEETGAANLYRGSSSLKFLGTGAQATIAVTQAITVGQLVPRKRYCFTLRYKASAVDTVAQAFEALFTGTGYTATASEKISVAGDVFDTSFTLKSFYINMPANIPTDFAIVIRATGTLSNTRAIYIDSIGFKEVTYHGGVNFVIPAGSTPFVRGDRFTFAVTNDQAGLFQDFFRRAFDVQLPSAAAGSNTISDNLAN